jgi:hypothetical protein
MGPFAGASARNACGGITEPSAIQCGEASGSKTGHLHLLSRNDVDEADMLWALLHDPLTRRAAANPRWDCWVAVAQPG